MMEESTNGAVPSNAASSRTRPFDPVRRRSLAMKITLIRAVILALISFSLPACDTRTDAEAHDEHQIVVTSPEKKDVVVTQQYVCQIHAQRHIEVQARTFGILERIPVKEGQWVKEGDLMFKVIPTLYQAKYNAEKAKVQLALLKYNNTKRLAEPSENGKAPVVSKQELALFEAELQEAQSNLAKAEVELSFAEIRAPFDGIIDRLQRQQGSTIKEGEILTTLSDNSVMWVYFNVPEARYLEFKAAQGNIKDNSQLELVDSRIELVLANGSTFNHASSNTVTVEGKFNNETGNIPFRADFPNPEGLLRHGQTGKVVIHRTLHNAIVIPQRATFEVLDKRYVYVVDKDNIVHQRPITIYHEIDDIFIIKSGLDVNDKIVLEGVRQVHEGEKLKEYEFLAPEVALSNQKNHAE